MAYPSAPTAAAREMMNNIAPAGPIYQAGTLSGNPLSMTAGLVTLRRLRDESVYERLERSSKNSVKGSHQRRERRALRP